MQPQPFEGCQLDVVAAQSPAGGWAALTAPNRKYTLVFIVDVAAQAVLLGLKKRGFGTGQWNGLGGKVESGETALAGAIREVEEESGLVLAERDVHHAADFIIGGRIGETVDCAVYTATTWSGEPAETDEMRPAWFAISDVPYARMWPEQPHYLPQILTRVLAGSSERLAIRVDYVEASLSGWWIGSNKR